MDTFLGLLGLVAWLVGTVALAAGVTWTVIKLSPGKKPKAPVSEPPAS